MSIGTKINLFFNYEKFGIDQFGNQYFIAKKVDPISKNKKRMVLYNGIAEATKVPPVWRAWLQYTIDNVTADLEKKYNWQKEFTPNMTGTLLAYRPPGHIAKGGIREEVSSDYVAWKPSNNDENK